jgi:methylenetetrahydrofolate dehydrogenase (NADP+)/methenyltetrahydrofolate cyclohydrolase
MILDGKTISNKILSELKDEIGSMSLHPPGLAFLLIGDHPASKTYVDAKKKRCQEVGIQSIVHKFEASVTLNEVLHKIKDLNRDSLIDGILVQLPLPRHLDKETILSAVDPSKDVDGFHLLNMGKLCIGSEDGFVPCTPLGIIELLKQYDISCEGKHAVILGRSTIVGKPLALLLMQNKTHLNATVTVAHSKTANLASVTKSADLLIAAIGSPHFVSKEMVKEGAIVIDVGINRLKDGALVGDVDYATVAPRTSHITPVPGGVGPMTIAMLLQNTWLSYVRRNRV